MPKQHYWVFRLHDAAGNCLYVGRTGRVPVYIARSYVTTREWGHMIDLSRIEAVHHATEQAAINTEWRWLRKYDPPYRAQRVRGKPKPRPSKVVYERDLPLLERVRRSQERRRVLSK